MATPTRSVVETKLVAALAASGTLVIGYPAGTNPGSFVNGKTHRLVTGSNDVFKSPKYFTLSFGASSITLTWDSAAPTLPIGTVCFIQLDRAGSSPQDTLEARNPALNNTAAVALKSVNWGAPAAKDTDGYCASQTVTGVGTAALINGALVASGVGVADVARNVVAGWTNTAILTITGKDEYGNTIVETTASGVTHTGKKAFKRITGITTNATVTGLTVGTGDILGVPVFVPGAAAILAETRGSVIVNGNREPVYVSTKIVEADVDAGTSAFVVAPVAGYITGAKVVSAAAVTTGGTFTFKIATVAVVGLSVVVADGGGTGGVYDSDVPTSLVGATGLVAAGDIIEIAGDAAFNASSDMYVTLTIQPLNSTNGTFVAGKMDAKQSSTTGDVRGTYQPSIVPDGATSYGMVLMLADPDFLGDDQYAG